MLYSHQRFVKKWKLFLLNAPKNFVKNIVWCKYSRVIKDLSKGGSFFLLNAPKKLRCETFFILAARKLYVFCEFSEMYSSQKKKIKKKKNP